MKTWPIKGNFTYDVSKMKWERDPLKQYGWVAWFSLGSTFSKLLPTSHVKGSRERYLKYSETPWPRPFFWRGCFISDNVDTSFISVWKESAPTDRSSYSRIDWALNLIFSRADRSGNRFDDRTMWFPALPSPLTLKLEMLHQKTSPSFCWDNLMSTSTLGNQPWVAWKSSLFVSTCSD